MRSSSTVGDGTVRQRRVSISDTIGSTEVLVRDGNGWQARLRADLRPKGTVGPAEGEIWLIERVGQIWVLKAMIGVPAKPVVTGSRDASDALTVGLLTALAEQGHIVDQTTGAAPGGTTFDFNAAVRLNRLDQMAQPTAALDLNGQRITDLADPAALQDAATKRYVDQQDAAERLYLDLLDVAAKSYVDQQDAAERAYADSLAAVAAGDRSFTHLQSASSMIWDVIHDLPFIPNVLIVDSAGSVVCGNEQVIGPNHTRITFSAPFSGSAYLS